MKIYHISTKGIDSFSIFNNDNDYILGVNTLALLSYNLRSPILAFCLMSNHVHFIISCPSSDAAFYFITEYKRLISMRLYYSHQQRKTLKNIDVSIKQLTDSWYLKKCIAYVLRNPIAADIVTTPENYRWSSYRSYFSQHNNTDLVTVKNISKRQAKKRLRTHYDLSQCNFKIDSKNVLHSFIDHQTVMDLYKNDYVYFLSFIVKGNDSEMEKELGFSSNIKITNRSILTIVKQESLNRYGTEDYLSLSLSEKKLLIKTLYDELKVNKYQLGIVFKIGRDVISSIIQ